MVIRTLRMGETGVLRGEGRAVAATSSRNCALLNFGKRKVLILKHRFGRPWNFRCRTLLTTSAGPCRREFRFLQLQRWWREGDCALYGKAQTPGFCGHILCSSFQFGPCFESWRRRLRRWKVLMVPEMNKMKPCVLTSGCAQSRVDSGAVH